MKNNVFILGAFLLFSSLCLGSYEERVFNAWLSYFDRCLERTANCIGECTGSSQVLIDDWLPNDQIDMGLELHEVKDRIVRIISATVVAGREGAREAWIRGWSTQFPANEREGGHRSISIP